MNPITRDEMIKLLNEDLAREYQAIIAYVVYSQTIKGAKFQHIAKELEKHAKEELDHAIKVAKQIDYLNGKPVTEPKPVKVSDKAEDMLHFDMDNERTTLVQYRQRIQQAEAMGEFALSEVLREIVVQEQEHLTDLANALGIDNPKIEAPKPDDAKNEGVNTNGEKSATPKGETPKTENPPASSPKNQKGGKK